MANERSCNHSEQGHPPLFESCSGDFCITLDHFETWKWPLTWIQLPDFQRNQVSSTTFLKKCEALAHFRDRNWTHRDRPKTPEFSRYLFPSLTEVLGEMGGG